MKPFVAFLGPLIWAAYFLTVYAAQGLACRGEAPAGYGATLFVVLASGFALAGLAVLFVMQVRAREPRFLCAIAVTLTLLSLLGVAWVGLPALLLPACVPAG